MCGIAGIFPTDSDTCTPRLRERMATMNAALRHRGPDDIGLYLTVNGRGGLANSRLAIRDLSPAGHMPMDNDAGTVWITYNGEVYNAEELRRELEDQGYQFRSRSDTEVILRGYEAWGDGVVERLRGIFAFAIWDEREQSLFLARDRFGVKPLYYAFAGGSFVFASEVRGILASGLVDRRADPGAIAGYLMLGSVPDDRTIVHDICSLPPAHHATLRGLALSVRRYWSHAETMRAAEPLAEGEVEEAVREGLKEAVRRQLVSDVPLGLFLSGGMDSSMLAALMRSIGCEHIRSVSIGFDEEEFDELPVARRTAQRFGTDHVECRITAADVLSQIDRIIDAMDQPTVDGVNSYLVSKAARDAGLTVALSGLGADELFGGYTNFKRVQEMQRVMCQATRIPGHAYLAGLAASAPAVPYRMRKLASWLNGSSSLAAAYLVTRGVLPSGQVTSLMQADAAFDAEAYCEAAAGAGALDAAGAISLLESRLYMQNQLLRDTDAMSMAHSLEVRVPYLDEAVTLLGARSRSSWTRTPKAPLAAARSMYFPLGLSSGPKRGFTFPFETWLRGPLAGMVEETAARPRAISAVGFRRLLTGFGRGHNHWSHVWAPTVLERWLDTHHVSVDGR